MIPEMLWLAGLSLAVCCGQFYIGRRIGARCGDKIAGAQGLGQKNTVLAIWMALTYLHPHRLGGPGGICGVAKTPSTRPSSILRPDATPAVRTNRLRDTFKNIHSRFNPPTTS